MSFTFAAVVDALAHHPQAATPGLVGARYQLPQSLVTVGEQLIDVLVPDALGLAVLCVGYVDHGASPRLLPVAPPGPKRHEPGG